MLYSNRRSGDPGGVPRISDQFGVDTVNVWESEIDTTFFLHPSDIAGVV
jgi:hypothetical protein